MAIEFCETDQVREARDTMFRFVRLASIDEIPEGGGKAVEVGGREIALFRIDGQIHVQGRPAQVTARRTLDLCELSDRGVPKPGKLGEREEELSAIQEQPQPVRGHIRQLNSRSAIATLF